MGTGGLNAGEVDRGFVFGARRFSRSKERGK